MVALNPFYLDYVEYRAVRGGAVPSDRCVKYRMARGCGAYSGESPLWRRLSLLPPVLPCSRAFQPVCAPCHALRTAPASAAPTCTALLWWLQVAALHYSYSPTFTPSHPPHLQLFFWWLQVALGIGTAALVSTFVFPITAGRKIKARGVARARQGDMGWGMCTR